MTNMKLSKYLTTILLFLLALFSCNSNSNNWYIIEKINSSTFIISEPKSSQKNSSYLIIGENEALLFDAGTGENKDFPLNSILEKITQKPIVMVLSHFHFDHIGNLNEFKTIALTNQQMNHCKLINDSIVILNQSETLTQKEVQFHKSKLVHLQSEIDLGNRIIKILPTPGHSKVGISLLDQENKFLFTGDLVYNGLLLIDSSDQYLSSLKLLRENVNVNHRIFGAHGQPEIQFEQLEKIAKAVELFCNDSTSVQPQKKIKLFGNEKNLYEIEGVSFIHDYSNIFLPN